MKGLSSFKIQLLEIGTRKFKLTLKVIKKINKIRSLFVKGFYIGNYINDLGISTQCFPSPNQDI